MCANCRARDLQRPVSGRCVCDTESVGVRAEAGTGLADADKNARCTRFEFNLSALKIHSSP